MNTNLAEKENKSRTRANYGAKSGCLYRCGGSLLVVKEVCNGVPRAFHNTNRSVITGFSDGSSRRMRRYLRECLPEYKQMVTLTYPFSYPADGKIVKEHLRRFIQELKREQERHNLVAGSSELHSSFWFLEFQERGAPHFHILTTWAPVPRGTNNWVAKKWYDIVNSEDQRHLAAGTRTEFLRLGRAGIASYAAKYAVKNEQKRVPEGYENVGRWWGVSGYRATVSAATYVDNEVKEHLDVKEATNKFFRYVQLEIMAGKIEVYVRDQGVLVAQINDIQTSKRVRAYIGMIMARTMVWEDFFDTAEVSD